MRHTFSFQYDTSRPYPGRNTLRLEPPSPRNFCLTLESNTYVLKQTFDAFCKLFFNPSPFPVQKYLPSKKNPGYDLDDLILSKNSSRFALRSFSRSLVFSLLMHTRRQKQMKRTRHDDEKIMYLHYISNPCKKFHELITMLVSRLTVEEQGFSLRKGTMINDTQ